MPDGIRWNFHFSPSRTIVWPALLPPWKRMTRSAFSASRSVTLPLPSSPHWAPTMTKPAMSDECRGGAGLPARAGLRRGLAVGGGFGPVGPPLRGLRRLKLGAVVVAAQQERVTAHLDQARHRPLTDLLAQLVLLQVGGDHHGPAVLVAGVDDRVELLEDP